MESHVPLETEIAVEEDQLQLYLSEDEETTVMGYAVGEYHDHPMIGAMITDIERDYLYTYNQFPPVGMMYHLVKERIE